MASAVDYADWLNEHVDKVGKTVTEEDYESVLNAYVKARDFEAKPIGTPKEILAEPLIGMGTGLVGELVGGAAGGARSLVSGMTPGIETREAITGFAQDIGQPRTRIGQIGTELVGRGTEAISGVVRAPLAYVAGKTEEMVGDPAKAAETAQSVREQGVLPTLSNRLLDAGKIGPYGYAGIQLAPELGAAVAGPAFIARQRMAKNKQIADELRTAQKGELTTIPPRDLAPYKLTSTGRATTDHMVKPLVRKGFGPAQLSEYKAGNTATRDAMLRMTDIKERGQKFPQYGRNNRPADVVGESLLPRIEKIREENRKAGLKVNEEANKLKTQTVDFSGPFDDFVVNLEDMGIPIRQALENPEFWQGSQGKVLKRIKTLYEGSDIDLMPKFQKPLTNVIYRAGTGNPTSAYDLHTMKRFIDSNITYGKAEAGLQARVGNTLRQLRSDIDDILDSNFEDYRKANDDYSVTINALDKFQDVMPKRIDLTMRNIGTALKDEFRRAVESAVGQETRKLESNYGIRNNLRLAIDEVDRVSRRYGGVYDEDLGVLTTFTTDLDEMFGPTGRNTLEGRLVRGVKEATSGKSRTERVEEFMTEKLSPDDEQAYELLRRMLREDEWQ